MALRRWSTHPGQQSSLADAIFHRNLCPRSETPRSGAPPASGCGLVQPSAGGFASDAVRSCPAERTATDLLGDPRCIAAAEDLLGAGRTPIPIYARRSVPVSGKVGSAAGASAPACASFDASRIACLAIRCQGEVRRIECLRPSRHARESSARSASSGSPPRSTPWR